MREYKRMMDLEVEITIRCALRTRREQMIKGWLSTWQAICHYDGRANDLEFWSREIRNVNDADIAVLRESCPEVLL